MLNVVDLSSNNGPVDLARLKRAGCRAVIIKATEKMANGGNYINPYFKGQIEQAIKLGLKIGAYHFFSGNNPSGNVTLYWSVVKPYAKYIDVHVADYEGSAVLLGGVSYGHKVLQLMEKKTGKKPWLYTSLSIENQYDWSSCTKYPLWLAQYNDMNYHSGFTPRSLYGHLRNWKRASMLQYSSTNSVAGYYPLDVSIYYGSSKSWSSYKGGGKSMIKHWRAPIKFTDEGAFKVTKKSGATIWNGPNNDKKVGHLACGKTVRITKVTDWFYKIAGKNQWLDARTGDFRGNPTKGNKDMHAIITVVKTTAGHAKLDTHVTGKNFEIGTHWVMHGWRSFTDSKGKTWHWALVGVGKNRYINLDKCRVLA